MDARSHEENPRAAHPTRDELLAMAYVDGELAADACREFELRLASEPDLLREVSSLRSLEVLARQVTPTEPTDWALSQLASDPSQLSMQRSGLVFLLAALILVPCTGLWLLWHSEAHNGLKLGGLLALAGLVLCLLVALRQRIKTRPLDPYRGVKR